mgnify:FL=1
MERNNENELLEEFLTIAYDSMKWDKWMLKNSTATYRDKAIIAGHYVFSSTRFIELKEKASHKIDNLELFLKQEVKKSIFRYIKAFNLSN